MKAKETKVKEMKNGKKAAQTEVLCADCLCFLCQSNVV